jgi:hypothetical protein
MLMMIGLTGFKSFPRSRESIQKFMSFPHGGCPLLQVTAGSSPQAPIKAAADYHRDGVDHDILVTKNLPLKPEYEIQTECGSS